MILLADNKILNIISISNLSVATYAYINGIYFEILHIVIDYSVREYVLCISGPTL